MTERSLTLNTAAHRAGCELCEAVATWVSKLGGIPIEVGPIMVTRHKRQGWFTVSFKCRGVMPSLEHEIKPKRKVKRG